MPSCAPAPFVTYLEMGAGDTASHLLEEGLLDLHKLGGLDDIKNLLHLPQEHHLGGAGQQLTSPSSTHLLAFWKLSPPHYCQDCENPSYLLLGAGFRPVFEEPPDNLEVEKKSDPKSEGPTFPPGYSHALSRLHPSPRTAPHSMPAAGPEWKEVAKVRKGQEPRTSCLGQRARHLLITAFTLLFTEHLLLLWTYKAPSSACRRGTGLVCEVSSQEEDTELVETQG